MEKFQKFLEEKLGPVMSKLGSNRYLLAVRDGVIAALPLIIVGSFFLIIANPPLPEDWGVYQFLKANAATILLPYRMTMYIMSLYAVFGMGNSKEGLYRYNPPVADKDKPRAGEHENCLPLSTCAKCRYLEHFEQSPHI